MMGNIMSMIQGMDEQQAKRMLDQIDDQQMQEGLEKLMEMYIVPHMEDVRQNVQGYPDPQDVRETYRNLPEPEQQEVFDDAVQEVVVTANMLRQRPKQGTQRLKSMLRDPTTYEALLLIFENEAIDAEYRDHLKDFTAEHLHWIGVFLAPSMYHPDEVRRVADQFGMEIPDSR